MPSIARPCVIAALAAILLAQAAPGQCQPNFYGSYLRPPAAEGGTASVSTDGDYLLVGGYFATDVYRRFGGGWIYSQQLPEDGLVALDGQWLAIADDQFLNSDISLYRLTQPEGTWTFFQRIPCPIPDERFGHPLVLDGNRLMVGLNAARLYEFNDAIGQWELEMTFPHAATAVALSGDQAAATSQGTVHAYQRTEATGQWTPLTVPLPPASSGDFGAALAFDGDTLLVGDPGVNVDRGAVHVYNRTANDALQLAGTVAPPSLAEGARFGSALVADENVLAVMAPALGDFGEVYLRLFVRSADLWTEASSTPLGWGPFGRVRLSDGQWVLPVGSAVLFSAGISDFDLNGIIDRCDVAFGTYADTDCDHIPDVSPLDHEPAVDCDGDGQFDDCGLDCDENRVADRCQLALGLSQDCNANGRIDSCDIEDLFGGSPDCNENGIPDECDLASGTSLDCNSNGVPDECDPDDCNNNGIPDSCELADGASDCDGDGLLDECECSINADCASLVHFTDVTAAAGLTAPNRRGYHYGGAGGATADFNNDGWQDIYFGGGANPDQLYLNNGDGTFRSETAAWGVLPGDTQGAAVADYDANGWLDVFVGGGQYGPPSRLYRNNGDNTFTDVADFAGVALNVSVGSAAWGDYDRDGDLDLVASNAGFASNPNANTIFRNNSDGTFTDVTIAVGVAATMRSDDGCGVRLFDFDGDGWQDLLWTSRFGHPHYYVGGGGRFQERPGTFNDSQISQGSGLAVGDFDEDGDFDLCVTTAWEPIPSVFRNDVAHVYARVPPPPLSPDPDWQMAAQAVDIDLDTRPDLVITTKLDGQFLYHNTGAPGGPIEFNDVSQCTNFISTVSGRGMATFDYDNDGDRDVILFPHDASDSPYQGEPPVLLRNDLAGPDTNWIRIFLTTSAASDIPPNGIGSVVKVRLGEGPDARTLMGFIDGGSNYLSQSELSAHFGLAGATVIDEITVEWTNGTTTTLTDVPANQTLTIAAPATTCPADLDRNAAVNIFDLLLFIDRWFAGDANYDNTGSTDIFDLLAYLDAWFTGC